MSKKRKPSRQGVITSVIIRVQPLVEEPQVAWINGQSLVRRVCRTVSDHLVVADALRPRRPFKLNIVRTSKRVGLCGRKSRPSVPQVVRRPRSEAKLLVISNGLNQEEIATGVNTINAGGLDSSYLLGSDRAIKGSDTPLRKFASGVSERKKWPLSSDEKR